MDGVKLAKLLKSSRQDCGFTLQHVADQVGCVKSYIWDLEAGKHQPGIVIAYKLARLYQIDLINIAKAADAELPTEE